MLNKTNNMIQNQYSRSKVEGEAVAWQTARTILFI